MSASNLCTNIATYYASASLSAGSAALKLALHRIISPHTVVSYNEAWDALRDLDASPSDASRVRLIYSSHTAAGFADQGLTTGWNREHSWPKSYGVGYSGPDFSDLHAAAQHRQSESLTGRTRGDRQMPDVPTWDQ